VVPLPAPIRILELGVIELLVDQGVIVICAGGGGIPTARRTDGGLIGVEAVIDPVRTAEVAMTGTPAFSMVRFGPKRMKSAPAASAMEARCITHATIQMLPNP
jgi:hypothetical protein